jgi:RNA 3'-terminal phosphate cyclase (ATP)
MARLIPIDGAVSEGGGQILRTALALSTVTGQGFEMTRIRAGSLQPGLRPPHLAALRAAAMICGAKVGGAFEGSPDVRFEPGPVVPGTFQFEIGAGDAVTLILQTVLAPLATAAQTSRVEVSGGTHVPASPGFHYFSRHWLALVARLGLHARAELVTAGFYPKGGGEVAVEVEPWSRPGALSLEARGPRQALRGISVASRLRGDVAEKQRDAAAHVLWESRRLEVEWDTVEPPSASPGSFILVEAVFENGRGAFGHLGERGVDPETIGERAARDLLRFLENDTGAVDGPAADQLVLPLALARGGGRITTTEVTAHLETVARLTTLFGIPATVTGRRGGSGSVDVGAH